MLALFQLLEKEPDIEGDTTKLRCYFKVAFTNHIKDIIRRQESQKHRFNRMIYEEITETAYQVPSKTLVQDDLVAFYGALESYESQLTSKEKEAYGRFLSGGRFKGKKKLAQELARHLEDFREWV